ncbi:hypothetical protein LCGC14_2573430 [marine sediment metagenome]|uniref:Uncharacterized protein n=1 Tax=marine sediment metagenome TaxID=412755 RepID=A0A0F9D9B7_9ZZZZ
MANRLTTNPVYFDQFNADATIFKANVPYTITKIRWKSVSDGDVLSLEDKAGNVVFQDIQTSATDWRDINFAGGQKFHNGLFMDVSKCTGMAATNGTDALYIYLA